MFKIDDKEIIRFTNHLERFSSKAVPFATRNTLNNVAFTAQKISRNNVRGSMVQRNRFTVQSIQVDKAETLDISRQSSTVGSIAPYMHDQEFGATQIKTGKEGVSIPTAYSAGQGMGTRPRTRLPRRANKLASIQLKKRRKKGATRGQRTFIAVREAAASGRKFVYLDLGRRKGIFRVVGGKRKPRIKMVHDLTRQSIVVPRNPWLEPVVDEVSKLLPGMYRESLLFQIKRNRLFRG